MKRLWKLRIIDHFDTNPKNVNFHCVSYCDGKKTLNSLVGIPKIAGKKLLLISEENTNSLVGIPKIAGKKLLLISEENTNSLLGIPKIAGKKTLNYIGRKYLIRLSVLKK